LGETRVDLLHLLEDLRDAYPGSIEETILSEVVANSLDSGSSLIRVATDPTAVTFTMVDDGSGMQRRDLRRYHDIAATTKTRGAGIGFAGVGIKLGLLISDEVCTETRRGKTHIATLWHLSSRRRAPWKWVSPVGFVPSQGTGVRLRLSNPLSPLLDGGFLESTLRRHYLALFDPTFDDMLSAHYPRPVRFEINGRLLPRYSTSEPMVAPFAVRMPRKRKPSAAGYLVRSELSLPEDEQGIALSTFGKIIKRGWDWIGVTPVAPERIGGVIEAPQLAGSLTLNKADFIRTGPRGAVYLAYRKALQQGVSRQLEEWGDTRDHQRETARRAARPIERDLERVLADLSADFPLLAALVERRTGGQRRLPVGTGAEPDARGLVATSLVRDREVAQDAAGQRGSEAERPEAEREAEAKPPPAELPPDVMPGRGARRRPARYGLAIQFEEQTGNPELGRLVESTVWVNIAHPAYRRAVASRSEGYHIALAVAMALAPLAVETEGFQAFVTAFLSQWGEGFQKTRPARRNTTRQR
jgi:hypothetical protein